MERKSSVLAHALFLLIQLHAAAADSNIWSKETLCWKKKRGVCISTAKDDWACPDPHGQIWHRGCPEGHLCCISSRPIKDVFYTPISSSCGQQPKQDPSAFRIVGGYFVTEGQLPWQVMIRPSKAFVGSRHPPSFCGGAIIAKEWILTAAHCFDNAAWTPKNIRVVSGLVDQYESVRTDIARVQILSVAQIIKHEKYDSKDLKNDIAVLKLAKPVRFDDFSAAICLPRAKHTFVNRICTVAGWGFYSNTIRRTSAKLRAVHIPVIPWDRCNRTHLEKSHENTIFKTNICVNIAAGGRDACDGDSGGPLTCQLLNGQNVVAGVVSWGDFDGCAKGLPSVLTDVQAYLDWIHAKTGLQV